MEWNVYAIIKIKDTKEHSPEQISTNDDDVDGDDSECEISFFFRWKYICEILIEEQSDSRKTANDIRPNHFVWLTNGCSANFYIVFFSDNFYWNSSMGLHTEKSRTPRKFFSRFQFIYTCTWIKGEKTWAMKLWRKESHDMTWHGMWCLQFHLKIAKFWRIYNILYRLSAHIWLYKDIHIVGVVALGVWNEIETSYKLLNSFETTNRLIRNYILSIAKSM